VTDADLRSFLAPLSARERGLVRVLRRVIRQTIPRAEESLLWGALSYHRPEVGGRVKGAVCLIVTRRGQVRLDFIHGIRLADPAGLLRGEGVSKRFVPIESVADAERRELAALLQTAAAVEFEER
jgi:hypothetical protein